jgi:hypothetical protein
VIAAPKQKLLSNKAPQLAASFIFNQASDAVGGGRLMFDPLKLEEYPTPMVRLDCLRCDRRGEYRRDDLIAEYGSDMSMPDLRYVLAKCERHGKEGQRCGIYYADLVPSNWNQILGHD